MRFFNNSFRCLLFLTAVLSSAPFLNAQDSRAFGDLNPLTPEAHTNKINRELDKAYQNLARNVSFEIKMKSVTALEKHFRNPRVVPMIMALLNHNYGYDNPNFTESRQGFYQNDLIVEKMTVILGKNGNPESFPTLLNIVVNPRRHREATVNAAWKAIQILRYEDLPDAGN